MDPLHSMNRAIVLHTGGPEERVGVVALRLLGRDVASALEVDARRTDMNV